MLGSIVDTVLVQGLLLIERLYPLPERLGAPLVAARRPRIDADPVVLVGGFANLPSGWNEWRRSLEADGFQVFVFDPPTAGLGDMETASRLVAAFIEQVRRQSGRARVDVVGFSEGGVLARMAVAQHGQLGAVDRLITLATPHHGIQAPGVRQALEAVPLLRTAVPIAVLQLLAGSALLARINRDDEQLRLQGGRSAGSPGDLAAAPRYASIFSRSHDLAVASTSSWLPGAFNIPVQGDGSRRLDPNHFQMFHTSNRAYEAARILLLDEPERAAAAAGLDSLA